MKHKINKALNLRKWVSVGHHIPGRIRLKYKLGLIAKLASYRTKEIEQTIADIPAFKHYKLNAATGSIVIEYDAHVVSTESINALFSASDTEAEQACYAIAKQLKLDGE